MEFMNVVRLAELESPYGKGFRRPSLFHGNRQPRAGLVRRRQGRQTTRWSVSRVVAAGCHPPGSRPPVEGHWALPAAVRHRLSCSSPGRSCSTLRQDVLVDTRDLEATERSDACPRRNCARETLQMASRAASARTWASVERASNVQHHDCVGNGDGRSQVFEWIGESERMPAVVDVWHSS